jgi:two-component sensor histidine kinase
VRAPNGSIVSIVATVRDATARKTAERRQALLVRELHHRVRNTLATVQAIAGASARYATSLEEFRETFAHRIGSLARAHAILTEDNWQSVDLRELMLLELQPWADLRRATVEGPAAALGARAAIPIAMAIHELTTNAVKHGAFSNEAGRVAASWTVAEEGEARRLDLVWQESGGPEVTEPERRGFGALLLGQILKMQLDGEAISEFDAAGFRFTLRAALPEPRRHA